MRGLTVRALVLLLLVACGRQRPDSSGYTPLMRAARDGDVAAIRRLAGKDHDLNYQGREVVRFSLLWPFKSVDLVDIPARYWTPLITAAHHDQAASVRELLRLGADPTKDGEDGNALVVAARLGNLSAVKALLEGGADPSKGRGPTTPLTVALRARQYDAARLLLQAGADTGYGYDLQQALLIPLADGEYDVVREVYAKTGLAVPLTVGVQGQQVILNAVAHGHTAAAKVPISAVHDLTRFAGEERNELIVAAIGRDDGAEVLRLSRDILSQEIVGASLLGMAVGAGSRNAAEHLLRAGVQPDARAYEQRTPLMIGAEARGLGAAEAVIEAGADVNATGGRFHRTALIEAAGAGNVPLVELLLARGARTDVHDAKRWTALRAAAERGHKPVIDLLGASGVEGSVSLDVQLVAAHEKNDVRRMEELIKAGADPSTSTRSGASLLSNSIRERQDDVVWLLLRLQADPDFGGIDTAPLLMAATMGREDIVSALLKAGADPNLGGRHHERPLNHALRHPRIVRALVRAGSDVNARHERSESALGAAVRMGNADPHDGDRYRHSAAILRAAGATDDGSRAHPLSEVAAKGDIAAFEREVMKASGPERQRALVAAATMGQGEIARRLLDRGVTPSAAALVAAAEADADDVAALLLDRGVKPDQRSMNAAAASGAATVLARLQRQAMPVDRGSVNKTLLGRALIDAARKGDAAAVRSYVEAGADINWRGSEYDYMKPAFFVAVERDDVVVMRELMRAGADVNRREKFYHTHVTPLLTAALEGSSKAARVLIGAGADVHYADERGTTALSISEGQIEVNYLNKQPAFTEIREMLHQAGARPPKEEGYQWSWWRLLRHLL